MLAVCQFAQLVIQSSQQRGDNGEGLGTEHGRTRVQAPEQPQGVVHLLRGAVRLQQGLDGPSKRPARRNSSQTHKGKGGALTNTPKARVMMHRRQG